jgi:hypothetical protein
LSIVTLRRTPGPRRPPAGIRHRDTIIHPVPFFLSLPGVSPMRSHRGPSLSSRTPVPPRSSRSGAPRHRPAVNLFTISHALAPPLRPSRLCRRGREAHGFPGSHGPGDGNAIASNGQRKVNRTAVGATRQSTRKVRHLSAGLPGSSPA